MSPFTSKLIWVFLIVGGLFIAGSIFAYYGMESGAWLFLAFIGAGQVIAALWMRKLNRDKAKRESARPLRSPGERP